MQARIFRPARTAMQSGKARSRLWRLEYAPGAPKTVEPLLGWTSVRGTQGQVRLEFASREEAIAYAKREGLDFELVEPAEPTRNSRAYADNFRKDRKIPWSH